MICTHVVANIPPKTTYTSISKPTPITAGAKSRPMRRLMITPAPTIWAIM